jgi:hypothetical protein
MNPKSTKAKGNLLEDYVVRRLIDTGLDHRAYRQKGSGSGLNKGDIWNGLDLHFECKNVKNMAWAKTFRQIDDENVSHFPAVLVWHMPNTSLEDSKVVLDWFFFESLLIAYKGYKPPTDNPKLKWPLIRLKQAVAEVMKNLPDEV